MSKRGMITLTAIFGLFGVSDASAQCAFVRYPLGAPRQLSVWPIPNPYMPATAVWGVLKVRLLHWPGSPSIGVLWKQSQLLREAGKQSGGFQSP
jgi:hypothetical protein